MLPSHGLPFMGLHTRIDDLKAHHAERLDKTLQACAQPATAVQVLKVLFTRPLDAHQLGFATGETLAHLHHLMKLGRVVRTLEEDGVWRYRRA
ncbi:hypothetical protein amb2906 [Paramagnetospirillum magneticum AMB-1]|uniref:Metallo-beta-lactamase-like C-terminal domain-containing protein n=1 Tax=Paramagnetospirillum magneticum (strain ATCC 700264 / AMB-1) TaxID=342108 RepID=Q2W365_PARM1|nr:hypothetical protein amb2906 [Paramagnetospirillum magneticum AMB-1]